MVDFACQRLRHCYVIQIRYDLPSVALTEQTPQNPLPLVNNRTLQNLFASMEIDVLCRKAVMASLRRRICHWIHPGNISRSIAIINSIDRATDRFYIVPRKSELSNSPISSHQQPSMQVNFQEITWTNSTRPQLLWTWKYSRNRAAIVMSSATDLKIKPVWTKRIHTLNWKLEHGIIPRLAPPFLSVFYISVYSKGDQRPAGNKMLLGDQRCRSVSQDEMISSYIDAILVSFDAVLWALYR